MMFGSILWFPFLAAAGFAALVVGIILFVFWLVMLIDCAKRDFRNTAEKVVWLLVIIFVSWIGALIYLIVIRMNNPEGVILESKRTERRERRSKR